MKSRKRSSLTLAAILIVGLFLPVTEAQATAPTVITNETQLLQINNNRAGSYKLGKSLTLSSTPDGTKTYITDIFSGAFDGNGFTLSGLTGSLFSNIAGSVSNLKLVTASGGITTHGQEYYCYAGVLAGQLDEGVIDGVKVSGAISTGGDCGATGGLVGRASDGTILNSSSSVNVNSDDPNVGGLVGINNASISKSSSSGIVHGRYYTGGLVGAASGRNGSIDASFSTAIVSGGEYTGGLIGATAAYSTTVSRSAISGPLESLIGFKKDDDGDDGVYVAVVTDVGGSNSRNITNSSEWGENQYINSGVPYIKALKASGFYTDTTPTAPSAAEIEAAAKAAAAAAAAKREAEIKTARADISKTLEKADKLTADSFVKADIAGVTKENIAQVQAEILALPAALRTDINQVLKVARKYEVVGKVATDQIVTLPITAFVEVGLIPADSKNKAALIAAVKRASTTDRDSFVEIQAVIAAEAASIKDRKDRLAAMIARNTARDKARLG